MTSSFQPTRTDSAARKEFNRNYIQGQGQGGYGLFDTWGATEGLFGLGGKNKDLQQILDDPSTKYQPGQGYNLNWWQRNVSKITDQDVYNAKRSREVSGLRNKYGDEAEKYGITIDGKTTVAGLDKQLTNAKDIESLTTSLRDIKGGAAKLAELEAGGALTPDRLRTGIVDLNQHNKDTDPDVIAARALTNQQIQSARNADSLAQQNQTFQQNQLKWQQSQAAENDRNRWEDKREQRKEAALTREMNAQNNAMQMQLEYSRLAQQDRQSAQDRKDKAIMMLMQGLGNLGTAFTI